MKTVYDVKQALNPDLYVDMVRELQAQRKKPVQKKLTRRNEWGELFPICKNGK